LNNRTALLTAARPSSCIRACSRTTSLVDAVLEAVVAEPEFLEVQFAGRTESNRSLSLAK
jgi:hypothetical protein